MIMFLVYIVLLLRLTIFRDMGYLIYEVPTANLEIFKNLFFVRSHSELTFLYLLLGNIVCFIPLGFYMKEFSGRGILGCLFICLLVSLGIETAQYFLMVGVFEIDDLILNSFGSLLGILLWLLVEYLVARRDSNV